MKRLILVAALAAVSLFARDSGPRAALSPLGGWPICGASSSPLCSGAGEYLLMIWPDAESDPEGFLYEITAEDEAGNAVVFAGYVWRNPGASVSTAVISAGTILRHVSITIW